MIVNSPTPILYDFGLLLRGDTTMPLAVVMNFDDQPAFLAAGASALCQVRDPATDEVLLSWSTSAGTALLVDGGVLLQELPPAQTQRLPRGRFTCELEVTDAAGRVRTWLRGPIVIQGDVARG